MGMFDYVECEVELPDSPPDGIEFQTKSLSNTMAVYVITEDKRLVEQMWRPVLLRTGEVPRYAESPWPFSKRRVEHPPTRLVMLDEGFRDLQFHGEMYFYGSYPHWSENEPVKWYEYKARFTDGKLEWIRKVPDHAHTGITS